jgi:hypothetical protein
MKQDVLVPSVFMSVKYLMAEPVFAVCGMSSTASWEAEGPTRETFLITMIRYQPIAWVTLSAQEEQAAVIRVLLT